MSALTERRIVACMGRLAVNRAYAEAILARNEAVCALIVDLRLSEWEAAKPGSCCKPSGEHPLACKHLLQLWAARDYLALAKAGAPTDMPAWPCQCGGSGLFYGHGVVENGVFKGTTGVCFRCEGKGWQSDADRKRNTNYDRYVRRIPAA